MTLYPTLLGSAWTSLAPPVRRLHAGGARARGTFRVVRGSSWFARVIAAILGMPSMGEGVPLTLTVDGPPEREVWLRSFAGSRLRTVQWRRGVLLVEAMGLVQCLFRIVAVSGALVYEQVGARIGIRTFALPLPRFLAPRVEGRVAPHEDRVHVDVRVHAPIVGLLVAYEGYVTTVIDDDSPRAKDPS